MTRLLSARVLAVLAAAAATTSKASAPCPKIIAQAAKRGGARGAAAAPPAATMPAISAPVPHGALEQPAPPASGAGAAAAAAGDVHLEAGVTAGPQWRDATTLGLQRGFHVKKAPPPREEEDSEAPVASEGADMTSAAVAVGLQADDVSVPSWLDATALGLQRGFRVQKKAWTPLEDAVVEAPSVSGDAAVANDDVALALLVDEAIAPSWLDGTAVGLQRGFRVQKKAWTPPEDASDITPADSVDPTMADDAVAAGLLMDDASRPSWLDGAALGLQRGFRVQKKAWTPDDHEADAAANASATKREKEVEKAQPWLDITTLGLQRGFRIQKKAQKLVEDTLTQIPSGVASQDTPQIHKAASTTFMEQELDHLFDASIDAFAEEDALPWHEATTLGLQRGFKIEKKVRVPAEEDSLSRTPATTAEWETAVRVGLMVGDSAATPPNNQASLPGAAAALGSSADEGSAHSRLQASAPGLQRWMRFHKKASNRDEKDSSKKVSASRADAAAENEMSSLLVLQAVNSSLPAWNRTRGFNPTSVFV